MQPLRLLHIVGARPQFAKAAAVSRAIAANLARGGAPVAERLLHTGQHYDFEMSQLFFEELQLRQPDHNLAVGSGSAAYQTAASLEGIGRILAEQPCDCVIVYGDTNATLAGALAARQQHLRLVHVEAGVRTGNLEQAEELNRVVADRVSDLRCCCTELNLSNLEAEGLGAGSFFSGDTMYDNYLHFLPRMDRGALARFKLQQNAYILCTIHRAENTDHPERLAALVEGLLRIQQAVMSLLFPVHPRTRRALEQLGGWDRLAAAGITLCEPLGFHATQALLEHCNCVLTDSGGLQREAYFAGRFSVIPWEYASWPELRDAGWVSTGGIGADELVARAAAAPGPRPREASGLFGDGQAGEKILARLLA